MKNTCKFNKFALIAAIAHTMAGCNQPDDDPPASVAIAGGTLNQNRLSLMVGSSASLIAAVQPSNASNQMG